MKVRRRIGTVLLAAGLLALVYGAAVYFWRDPVTDLYARWKQHELAQQLDEAVAEYRADSGSSPGAAASTDVPDTSSADQSGTDVDAAAQAAQAETRQSAEAMYQEVKTEDGRPLGRIRIPRLDIDPVFVNGTRWGADLSRGPGRFPETFLPGMGRITAIAGHRTTFGAPFRHIDKLRAGDDIIVEVPYGTFTYEVDGHEIVDDEDWSAIRRRGAETLVLSACHPLFSASQRWIVYAHLTEVETPTGYSYAASDTTHADTS